MLVLPAQLALPALKVAGLTIRVASPQLLHCLHLVIPLVTRMQLKLTAIFTFGMVLYGMTLAFWPLSARQGRQARLASLAPQVHKGRLVQ